MSEPARIQPPASPSEQEVVQRARRLKQVIDNYPKRVGLFKRVYAGTASPRQCIKAFCLECNGWEERAIRECTAKACPLYGLRPYQRHDEPED